MFAQIETSEVAMSQHLTWGSMAESMAQYLSGGDKAVLTPDKYSAKAKALADCSWPCLCKEHGGDVELCTVLPRHCRFVCRVPLRPATPHHQAHPACLQG